MGPLDYNIFTNSQIDLVHAINDVPLKADNGSIVTVADVGQAKDAAQIQTNVVRVDGQPSVYLPVLRQGGDSNTIAIVNGVKAVLQHLSDVPKSLVAKLAFDQSIFVKNAIVNLVHEGATGLVLTGLMILVFLGSLIATAGVFLSIPLSVLATFIVLYIGGDTVNTMILGGMALAFSRLIDNSVVVLENIYRHMEMGESPREAAEKGGHEVALPVLAATLTTAIVFFPVTFLYGVSKYLFTALAVSVVLSLAASYIVALTVVPLFCAKLLRAHGHHAGSAHDAAEHAGPPRRRRLFAAIGAGFNRWFNAGFEAMLKRYDYLVGKVLAVPRTTLVVLLVASAASALCVPELGMAYFPRTDPGQFVINIKAPTGTRIEMTSDYVGQVELIVRSIVKPEDLGVIASNIGVAPGFSSIYTSNTGSHTAFVQVSLKEDHRIGSYTYMDEVRKAIHAQLPQLTSYFQSGGIVDAVLNLGLPAPIDVQVRSNDLDQAYKTATSLARQFAALPGVSDVFIPQDIDAPSLRIDVNREHAQEMGLSQREVVSNIITALTSNQMIAPSYWVDPKNGNDYFLTVQYPETEVKTLSDLKTIPISRRRRKRSVAARFRGEHQANSGTHGGQPLSARPRHRYLHRAITGEPPHPRRHHRWHCREDAVEKRDEDRHSGLGPSDAHLVPEFRPRTFPIGSACLPGARRAIQILRRSLGDPTCGPAGRCRRRSHSGGNRDHPQRHVADGYRDDGRDRGLEQHSDRGVRPPHARGRQGAGRRGRLVLPYSASADPDDLTRHDHRPYSHGLGARRRQRGLRFAGPRHHRRPHRLGAGHNLHRSRRLPACLPAPAAPGSGAGLMIDRPASWYICLEALCDTSR